MYSRSLNHIRRAPVFLNPRSFNVSKLHSSSLTPLRAGLSSHLRNGSRILVPLQSQNFQIQKRGEASSVAGRPGSQTPAHAAQNIKEEVGHAASDLAKTIAGANFASDSVKPVNETFLGITSAVASAVPQPVMIFGLVGGLPYIAASATTVYLARQAGIAAAGAQIGIDPGVALTVLDQAMNIQVTYGAVMLSFLGALHWGMEFSGYGGHKGYSRLMLGAAPVLFAWPTLALDPTSALIAQWCGFTALWWADLKVTNAGWTPKWYSQYRFYLSILVGTCIIGSLAGTSYFGPVAGHGIETHDLDIIRMERKKHQNQLASSGAEEGDLKAVPAGENADNYVKIEKVKSDKEGESEKK